MNRWSSCLAGLLAAACFAAAARAPTGAAEPLKEIQVAPEAFVRGAPVPVWADLLPLPPEDPALPAAALVVRLADSHLRVSPSKAYLVNFAEQAREASPLGAVGQPQLQFNPQHQRLLLHRVHIVRGMQALEARLKGDERELALAEAWFYIGEHHLAQGRRGEAREAFDAVRRQGITMYIEHVAAGHELKRLTP